MKARRDTARPGSRERRGTPWLVGLCVLFAAPSSARPQQPEPPEATSTTIPAAVPDALDFVPDKGRMTVPVEVDGRGPFPFVIDTGAERSVVSHELATQLQLGAGRRARLFDFSGASVADTVIVPSLAVSTLGTQRVEAPTLQLAHIGAPGMLGIDALQGHRVSIDFDRRRMTLLRSTRHPRGDVLLKAAARSGQLIVTEASYEGRPIAVVIDTGSTITMGNLAMLRLASRPPRRLGQVSIMSVTGRSFTADYVVAEKLTIGGVVFSQVPLSFADVPPFARFGLEGRPALILGMDALKLFRRVELDFANREVAFTLPRAPLWYGSVCKPFSPCNRFARN